MDSFSPLTLKKMDRAAASRQKSCNACVRGKRKCDKRTPRCTRCAAKGLECVYARTPPGSNNGHHDGHGVSGVHDVPDFDMGFDIEGLSTDTSPESLGTDCHLQLDSSLDFNIMDLMSNGSSTGSELWNLTDYSTKMEIPPVPAAPQEPIRDLLLLNDIENCMHFNPLDVHDTRTRVGYIIDYIAHMHRDFAQTRSLPFIHPRLYGSNLPKTILYAFSVSAAYSNRTPQNKAWVMKLVADTARDIHREGERASTSAEKLARVQALVVLDTIRMFDGDVALRAAAEREQGQIIAWTECLSTMKDELEEGVSSAALMTRERPPKSWENWVLLESVRRTVMMSFSFLCLSSLLKSIDPPCDILTPVHTFTASRHLWEADSSATFYRAWQEKPQYCVANMEFKDLWMYGRPEDVDEFTKLMLTAQAGPDAMDHFMLGLPGVPASCV
ncbi:Fc.00g067840.m01.CDS01 [Cosmosporella sp. VM-42]